MGSEWLTLSELLQFVYIKSCDTQLVKSSAKKVNCVKRMEFFMFHTKSIIYILMYLSWDKHVLKNLEVNSSNEKKFLYFS